MLLYLSLKAFREGGLRFNLTAQRLLVGAHGYYTLSGSILALAPFYLHQRLTR